MFNKPTIQSSSSKYSAKYRVKGSVHQLLKGNASKKNTVQKYSAKYSSKIQFKNVQNTNQSKLYFKKYNSHSFHESQHTWVSIITQHHSCYLITELAGAGASEYGRVSVSLSDLLNQKSLSLSGNREQKKNSFKYQQKIR